ncbi:hypothetical protein [Streptomyces sp. NPDC086989]|uniref:hypothetical protein n=1 Tax=Streptomyces sp. NPDC086989 TaxID=3365764 RepID=UPI0038206A52
MTETSSTDPHASEPTDPTKCSGEEGFCDDLRDLYAKAIYERNNPGHRWEEAHPDDVLAYGSDADAIITVRDPALEQARASRERWRRDYAELVDQHKRTAGELEASRRRAIRIQTLLDETRDRIRKLHRPVEHMGRIICAECSAYDGTGTTDSPPVEHPCPTIAALDQTA